MIIAMIFSVLIGIVLGHYWYELFTKHHKNPVDLAVNTCISFIIGVGIIFLIMTLGAL